MCRLYVDSLTKSFDGRQLLTDIYLTCKKGEIIGLLGRNGVGKTTLLKIIFGAVRADHKFIKIGSKRLSSLFDGREAIGYLPESHFLPAHVPLLKLVSLMCPEPEKMITSPVGHLLDKHLSQLSGGEKRLVEIFMVLHANKKIIILDEPFKGIDPLHKETIMEAIRKQSREKGFIITDHDHRSLILLATKIILLKDGGLIQVKDASELGFHGFYA